MRSKLIRLLAAAFFGASILAMATPSAYAETSDPTAKKSKVTPASIPTCVTVLLGRDWRSAYVDIYNDCKTTERVKIIIAWGLDSECIVLKELESYRFRYSDVSARFDGVVSC